MFNVRDIFEVKQDSIDNKRSDAVLGIALSGVMLLGVMIFDAVLPKSDDGDEESSEDTTE